MSVDHILRKTAVVSLLAISPYLMLAQKPITDTNKKSDTPVVNTVAKTQADEKIRMSFDVLKARCDTFTLEVHLVLNDINHYAYASWNMINDSEGFRTKNKIPDDRPLNPAELSALSAELNKTNGIPGGSIEKFLPEYALVMNPFVQKRDSLSAEFNELDKTVKIKLTEAKAIITSSKKHGKINPADTAKVRADMGIQISNSLNGQFLQSSRNIAAGIYNVFSCSLDFEYACMNYLNGEVSLNEVKSYKEDLAKSVQAYKKICDTPIGVGLEIRF